MADQRRLLAIGVWKRQPSELRFVVEEDIYGTNAIHYYAAVGAENRAMATMNTTTKILE